ncbi:MAG: hypothetical protein K0S38_104 [Candidatus Paceibacter sp.]|jgi:hypothetical protein|nr:hypothetical protein [Candidatus Paceibacter sp.]
MVAKDPDDNQLPSQGDPDQGLDPPQDDSVDEAAQDCDLPTDEEIEENTRRSAAALREAAAQQEQEQKLKQDRRKNIMKKIFMWAVYAVVGFVLVVAVVLFVDWARVKLGWKLPASTQPFIVVNPPPAVIPPKSIEERKAEVEIEEGRAWNDIIRSAVPTTQSTQPAPTTQSTSGKGGPIMFQLDKVPGTRIQVFQRGMLEDSWLFTPRLVLAENSTIELLNARSPLLPPKDKVVYVGRLKQNPATSQSTTHSVIIASTGGYERLAKWDSSGFSFNPAFTPPTDEYALQIKNEIEGMTIKHAGIIFVGGPGNPALSWGVHVEQVDERGYIIPGTLKYTEIGPYVAFQCYKPGAPLQDIDKIWKEASTFRR